MILLLKIIVQFELLYLLFQITIKWLKGCLKKYFLRLKTCYISGEQLKNEGVSKSIWPSRKATNCEWPLPQTPEGDDGWCKRSNCSAGARYLPITIGIDWDLGGNKTVAYKL